jgi:hypothetical protein
VLRGCFAILTWLFGGRRITLGPSSLRSRERLDEALLDVQRSGRISEPRGAILAFYTRIREEHWLRDKLEEGKIVILEDESIWEVHPSDRQITKRWLRMSTITVKHTVKEGYPYLLSNSTEGEDARANYLRDSTRTSITPEAA